MEPSALSLQRTTVGVTGRALAQGRLAGDSSKYSFGFETNERFFAEPLPARAQRGLNLSLIHISEPTRRS
eukprot:3022123-Prymnesium_polylepis.1